MRTVKLRVWMTWSELTNGPRVSKEQFQAQLARYPKSSILIACAKLSVGLGYGPDACTVPSEQVADFHIPIVFPPSLVPRVRRWFHQQERIPFFNGQLRYLAAETVRLQPPDPVPEIPENGPDNHQFGELMLKAGELLYKKHVVVEKELDGYANIAAEFLPTYEMASATDPLFSFLRFYIWLTKIVPRIPTNLLKFDLEAEFERVFSFPIVTYAEFIAMFAMHALQERQNQTYDKPVEAALRKIWFQKTTVPKNRLEQMFETVSFSLDNMPVAGVKRRGIFRCAQNDDGGGQWHRGGESGEFGETRTLKIEGCGTRGCPVGGSGGRWQGAATGVKIAARCRAE